MDRRVAMGVNRLCDRCKGTVINGLRGLAASQIAVTYREPWTRERQKGWRNDWRQVVVIPAALRRLSRQARNVVGEPLDISDPQAGVGRLLISRTGEIQRR